MAATALVSSEARFWLEPQAVVAARGADAIDLLNRLGTQDLRGLVAGETRFGMFVTHQGKLVAPVRVAMVGDALSLMTAPLQGRALCDWLERYTITEDATFEVQDESWPTVRLLAGAPGEPLSAEAAAARLAPALGALSPCAKVALACSQGWPGARDLLCAPSRQHEAQQALAALGLEPLDAAGRERYRLEVGEPAMGHELAPLCTPLEWRLGASTISWTKGCFVGQEVLGRLDNFDKVARLSMGVRSAALAAPLASPEGRAGARILQQGVPVGRIASVAPTGGDGFVGLGLVKRAAALPGAAELRLADGQTAALTLEHRPFWQAPEPA